jgi:putative salt-induced outer membrane protein YdiY
MRVCGLVLVLLLLLSWTSVTAWADEQPDVRAAIDAALREVPDAGRLVRAAGPARDAFLVGGAAPEDPWTFEIGLGLSLAKGNSDHFDLHVDGLAAYERGTWALKNKAAFTYGESDGTRSAENWHTEHRVDKEFGGCNYFFAQVNFDRDELADLEYRFTGLGGVGRTLLEGPNGFLKAEVGGGAVYEKRLAMPSTTSPSLYVGVDAERTWADGSKLTVEYDFVPNLSDFDLSFMFWDVKYAKPLCAELDLTIRLRLDYVLEPPAPTESLDILLAVGLQVRL